MLDIHRITQQSVAANSEVPGWHFWRNSPRLSCLAAQFLNKRQHPIRLSRTALKADCRAFLKVLQEDKRLLTILFTA